MGAHRTPGPILLLRVPRLQGQSLALWEFVLQKNKAPVTPDARVIQLGTPEGGRGAAGRGGQEHTGERRLVGKGHLTGSRVNNLLPTFSRGREVSAHRREGRTGPRALVPGTRQDRSNTLPGVDRRRAVRGARAWTQSPWKRVSRPGTWSAAEANGSKAPAGDGPRAAQAGHRGRSEGQGQVRTALRGH